MGQQMVRWRTEDRRKAQSTLEYILVLAAILVAVILMANGAIKTAVEKGMQDSKDVMDAAGVKIQSGIGVPEAL